MVNYGKYSINGGDDLSGLYDRTTNNHYAKQRQQGKWSTILNAYPGYPHETYVLIFFISKRLAVEFGTCLLAVLIIQFVVSTVQRLCGSTVQQLNGSAVHRFNSSTTYGPFSF
jgi:hypothetical protein